MLQLNDDGVLEKVDEEKLITVNIDDLNEFINEKERLEQELQKTQKELITIKNTIKEMYDNERTHLGHNVLAQLMEAIQ